MPINILMPALSPTMEEGNLAKWLVKEGDTVSSGDVIAEIETDKATMEVESIDEGTVGKILVAEGTEGVKVNELIAVLLEDGEDASAIPDAPATAPAAAPAAPAPATPAPATPAPDAPPAAGAPAAPAPALAAAPPAPATNGAAAPAPAPSSGGRVFASPLARRIAKDAGIDIASVSGSGPHGRIVKRDIDAAIAGGMARPAAAPAAAPSAPAAAPAAAPAPSMSDEQVMKLFEDGSYEIIEHDGMRKTIARRLTEAKSTIPHFYLTVDCELDALLALRAQINGAAPMADDKPAYKVSVNDMVIKGLAKALRDVPDANVTWTESGMLKHAKVDVGVAVAIPGGLITPVIRDADVKPLSVMSNEMKDYARRARDRKLAPHEYQGGTSAVSNLGMFGIKDFSAVINPPHATILAVGAGQQRPVVKDGALATATVMSVTLSTDHRAVDGALGAELLAAFKGYIESPMGLVV